MPLFPNTTTTGAGKDNINNINVVKKTTEFATSSTAFVDVPGLSITTTTGNNRVLIMFAGTISDSLEKTTQIQLLVDGIALGGTSGLIMGTNSGNPGMNDGSFSLLTDVLTAGSHTFKIQLRSANGGSATIVKSPSKARFSVMEVID